MKRKAEYKISDSKKWLILFFVLASSIMLLLIKKSMFNDSDSSFLLFEGRRIAKDGIQYTNGSAPIKGMKIVVQQWLYAFIFYEVYKVSGWQGIYVMAIIEVVFFVWLAKKLSEIHGYSKTVSICTAMLIGITYTYCVATEKPELITECLLLIEMIMLEKYALTENKKYLAFSVATVLAEANLHVSTWFIHIFFAIPYMIPYKRINFTLAKERKKGYSVFPVWIAAVCMCLVSMASPYGTEGMLYTFTAYAAGMARMNITELKSPKLKNHISLITFFMTIDIVKRIKEKHMEQSLTFLGCFIMFMISFRNIQFLLLAAIPILAGYIEKILAFKLPGSFKILNLLKYKAAYIFAVILTVTISFHNSLSGITMQKNESSSILYPQNAIQYLKKHEKKNTRIMTTFNTGSYMENAGYIIFMDGRSENWSRRINKKSDMTKEYIRLMNDPSYTYFVKIRNKYKFKYIMANKGSNLQAICDMDRTMCVVSKDKATVMYKVLRWQGDPYYL